MRLTSPSCNALTARATANQLLPVPAGPIAKVTIFLNEFPQGTTQVSSPLGPFTVSSSTSKIDTRARARLAAVQIENENVDESWRYGTFRFDVRVDGRR